MDIISKLKRKILIASEIISRSKKRHSEFDYRIVFRFDSWKLFKGHSGQVTVTDRTLCFETQIFNYRCHQWINNTDNMALKLRHQLFINPTRWLTDKLNAFEKNLVAKNIYKAYPKFVCVHGNYTFVLEHHCHITYKETYESFHDLYSHKQMIDTRIGLNKKARLLLNKIKAMSDEEFFEQVIAFNANEKPKLLHQGVAHYNLPSSLLD